MGVSQSTKANTLRASAKRALQWVVGLKSAGGFHAKNKNTALTALNACARRELAQTHIHTAVTSPHLSALAVGLYNCRYLSVDGEGSTVMEAAKRRKVKRGGLC